MTRVKMSPKALARFACPDDPDAADALERYLSSDAATYDRSSNLQPFPTDQGIPRFESLA